MKPLTSDLQECIDACNGCITAAKICLDQHIVEPDMKQYHKYCLDCIDLCTACVHMVAAQSKYVNRVYGIFFAELVQMNALNLIVMYASSVLKNVANVRKPVQKWLHNNKVKPQFTCGICPVGIIFFK